jgi:hypothetical protein
MPHFYLTMTISLTSVLLVTTQLVDMSIAWNQNQES